MQGEDWGACVEVISVSCLVRPLCGLATKPVMALISQKHFVVVVCLIKFYLFFERQGYRESERKRERGRERKRELPFSDSLPKWP